MNFKQLIENIRTTHHVLYDATARAINANMTIRNWLTGKFIVDFEQDGEDRARYGEAIVGSLAEQLNEKGFSSRNLKLFRQFYLAYPQFHSIYHGSSELLQLCRQRLHNCIFIPQT